MPGGVDRRWLLAEDPDHQVEDVREQEPVRPGATGPGEPVLGHVDVVAEPDVPHVRRTDPALGDGVLDERPLRVPAQVEVHHRDAGAGLRQLGERGEAAPVPLHRHHARAGGLCDVDGQRPPARADLGHGHAGSQAQLGGRADELAPLRLLQRVPRRVVEDGAGVVEAVVEEQAVEVGREVVMVAGVGGGDADGVRLVPAPQGAPKPPQRALPGVPA